MPLSKKDWLEILCHIADECNVKQIEFENWAFDIEEYRRIRKCVKVSREK